MSNDFNAQVISEFRASGGNVSGPLEGMSLLLLHHKGAKSGTARVSPLAFQRLNGSVAVFASKGGAPTNPDWFHNLVANPRTTIEIGADTVEVEARVAEGAERERIWEAQKRTVPQFADYERNSPRAIPVIVLDPVGGSA